MLTVLKRVSSIIEYIGWLLAKQRELQQHSILKIIDIKKNKLGENILNIQVTNKSTIFQCLPIEIISNDQLLEAFSKKDIRTITYLATQHTAKPKQVVVSHRFIDNFKKIICKIKNKNELVEKSLSEIVANKEINDFGSEDAYRIGYLAATVQSIQENDHFNKTSITDEGEKI